jgi:N6-adenosine-specific RNA methylase IME4
MLAEIEIPPGGFGVILADPPWRFITRSEKGLGKSPERHYQTRSLEWICSLPVKKLAARNCAFFLWVPWPKIFSAPAVFDAWGFKYSGLAFEWIKWNPVTGKYFFGAGYGTRKNLEPCLLARRGAPKVKSRGQRDLIIHAAKREHSRKPAAQYDAIEAMYDGPFLEIFATETRPGWQSWGDQLGKYEPAPAGRECG